MQARATANPPNRATQSPVQRPLTVALERCDLLRRLLGDMLPPNLGNSWREASSVYVELYPYRRDGVVFG